MKVLLDVTEYTQDPAEAAVAVSEFGAQVKDISWLEVHAPDGRQAAIWQGFDVEHFGDQDLSEIAAKWFAKYKHLPVSLGKAHPEAVTTTRIKEWAEVHEDDSSYPAIFIEFDLEQYPI